MSERLLRFPVEKAREQPKARFKRTWLQAPAHLQKLGSTFTEEEAWSFCEWSAEPSRRKQILTRISSRVIQANYSIALENLEDFWSDFSSLEAFRQRIRRFDPDHGELLEYAIRGCARFSIDRIRSRHRERQEFSEETLSRSETQQRLHEQEEQMDQRLILREIRHLLDTGALDPREASVVRQFSFYGKAYKEISRDLRISTVYARVTFFRAVQKLKKLLGERGRST